MHKAKWKGPQKRIPDLRLTLDRGDEFEISADVRLGGEGVDFDIVDGPAVEILRGEAKDLGVKGATKMTRLELEQAVTTAADNEKAEDEKASAGDDQGDDA